VKVKVHNGDVIFKRAHNGWIIQKVLEGEGEYVETYVVEDTGPDPAEALWHVFLEVCIDENR